MPPRKKEPVEAPEAAVDELCPEHYPHGWSQVPDHHNGVGCEHGSWTRPATADGDDES